MNCSLKRLLNLECVLFTLILFITKIMIQIKLQIVDSSKFLHDHSNLSSSLFFNCLDISKWTRHTGLSNLHKLPKSILLGDHSCPQSGNPFGQHHRSWTLASLQILKSFCAELEFIPLKSDWSTIENEHSVHAL